MKMTLTLDFDSAQELASVGQILSAMTECADEIEFDVPAHELPVAPPVAAEPKKRGRKPKAQPAEVVAAVPPGAPTPVQQVDALVDAAKATATAAAPPAAAASDVPEAEIKTGQQLQDYILSLVHQKRIDPVAVKAKVYPKYNVVRSLDMTEEQVPLALADVQAMLKPEKPAAPTNDLDL